MNGTLTKENSFVKNRAKLFASRSEEDALSDSPPRKTDATPSYVSLSCTVSGYSGLNRYDSRARQEISRSRDSSRDGRLPLCMTKSRDSSPSRIRASDLKARIPSGGFNLSDIPVINSSPQQLQQQQSQQCNGRSKSVDRGYLRQNFLNGFSKPPSGPSTPVSSSNTEERGRNRIRSSTVPNPTGDSKSVIQQRIERLYGPAALAGGFFLLKSPAKPTKEPLKSYHHNNNTITAKDVPDGCQTPPVFRHLNAQFRQQLQVKNKRSPGLAHSPSSSPVKDTTPPTSSATSPTPDVVTHQETPKTNGTVLNEAGHKFLKIMEDEKNRIECMIAKNELYLMDSKVESSDELTGKIRAAIGKAKLLLAQKFEQFAGLCHKNLTQSPDEPFPTTGEDLAGFWDMVMIQVDHIKSMFREIQTLKENNWIEPEEKLVNNNSATSGRPSKNRARPPPATSTARSAKAEEAAKAREEARKKMIEDRRKMAKAKKDEWGIVQVVGNTEIHLNGSVESEAVPV